MCSRHAEPGAGREYADPADYFCQSCLRNTYSGRLFRYQGRRVCAECAVRLSGEPLCDYCQRPTFGDYRRISRAHSVSIACGSCTDHWAERYEEAIA